jgi:hypothetical protein
MLRWLLTAAILGGLAAAAGAAYLEGEEEAGPPPASPLVRTLPPEPVPPPEPDNPLTRAVRRVTVRPGHSHRGLTVFPLATAEVELRTDYASAQEALAEGMLLVREKGAGEVPVLMARNRGARPVLLLAGEVLLGGKQDRTLRDDVLLPAESGWVALPVFCVEQGRWRGRAEFGGETSLAALKVRAGVQTGASQQQVWHDVSAYQGELNVSSPTGDLQAVADAPEVREALADYRGAFADCWRPATVGVVVARHGRIVGADLFCNPAVFRKHRDRILDSYAVDCLAARRRMEEDEGGLAVAAPHRREAERFLRRALGASYRSRPTPGLGRLLTLRGPGIRGAGLTYRGALVHAAFFGEALAIEPPTPRPLPDLPE